MPAREAKEAADVTRRYESWELMLELGGLADARPMTCKVTVYKQYIHAMVQYSQCGQRLRGNINSVPLHPIWCGRYFKRFLPVLPYLGETHDTAVGSPKEAAQNS